MEMSCGDILIQALGLILKDPEHPEMPMLSTSADQIFEVWKIVLKSCFHALANLQSHFFSHVVAQILLKTFGTDINVLRQQLCGDW